MARKTIGILSRESGVKVTTIRYYETIDLIAEPDRSDSGQRLYDDRAVERLKFIRHARDLGFPIESIRELINLQDRPELDCARVDTIASRQLADIRRRLAQLKSLEAELQHMVTVCGGGKTKSCKVLQTLSNHEGCLDEHPPSNVFSPIGF